MTDEKQVKELKNITVEVAGEKHLRYGRQAEGHGDCPAYL